MREPPGAASHFRQLPSWPGISAPGRSVPAGPRLPAPPVPPFLRDPGAAVMDWPLSDPTFCVCPFFSLGLHACAL